VPGEELLEPRGRVIGDVAQHVGELGLRVDVPRLREGRLLSLAVAIRVYIAAARSPSRSEPANNQARRPRAIARNARSAALLKGMLSMAPGWIGGFIAYDEPPG
jgi:hypothetical protein